MEARIEAKPPGRDRGSESQTETGIVTAREVKEEAVKDRDVEATGTEVATTQDTDADTGEVIETDRVKERDRHRHRHRCKR